MFPHTGSWGLPDFGLTEAIGDFFGTGRNAQGGSVLGTGDVAVSPTFQMPGITDYNQLLYQNNAQATPGTGSSSLDSGGGTGTSTGDGGSTAPSGPDPFEQALNDALGARLGALSNVENTLRSQQPGIESDLLSQFAGSQKALEAEKSGGLRDIQQQQTSGENRREDALNAARRLYNELLMGGQQRFGGASSAGEAFSALGGRELQRNRADIGQQFEGFMQQVEGARQTLNERFAVGLQQLETQKNTALNQVRRDFQNKLAEINNQRAAAYEDKANSRLQALQDYRNQIFSIDQAIAQQQGNLQQAKQKAEQQLQQFVASAGQQRQAATQAGQGFSSATTTNPNTSLAINDTRGGAQGPQFTGIRRDDELVGQRSPLDDRDRFNFLA